MKMFTARVQREDPEEDDRKPAAKRIKKEPEDDAQSVTQDEPKVETTVKPWEDKKGYEAIFRKYISIGEDSEEHVLNKKLITGSVRAANGAHMKMLCDGDINVDVITKNGDVTSGTLGVIVIPEMKQKLFSFTQAMMGGWTMQGGQTKQGELLIALTHEDHKHIIFDRILKAGNSVLLAAKMVIKNPEEVNAAIVNGKQSKEYFHRVTGHVGHHLMDATTKYYKVDLTGKVNNCLSCSLKKIRQKNIPKIIKIKARILEKGCIWISHQ